MSLDPLRRTVRCWECEATTAHPSTVILATASGVIGRLPRCHGCYAVCYLPLARRPVDPEAPVHPLLLVEPEASGDQTTG